MKFIQLNDSDGRTHYINIDQITNVVFGADGKKINLTSGNNINVKNLTMEQIINLIKNHTIV